MKQTVVVYLYCAMDGATRRPASQWVKDLRPEFREVIPPELDLGRSPELSPPMEIRTYQLQKFAVEWEVTGIPPHGRLTEMTLQRAEAEWKHRRRER